MKYLLEKLSFERRRFRVSRHVRRGLKQIICVALLAMTAPGQEQKKDLTELKLEDLMNIEVTSVSKKEEKLFQTAAAVYVITQDDIRHSSATSVPDLLRMVPGLEVAQINSNKWAISSRGFNGQFANKMLVLIDGRSVYTPFFSGVYWDVQDLVLEDIERIEVIRGPGASVWGANAVNGVINIITKRAEETQGGLLVTGAGTEEQGFGTLRYGAKAGRNAYYRLYAKYFNRDGLLDSEGRAFPDSWDMLRGGFRVDWDSGKRDSLTVQGDIYNGDIGQRQRVVSLTPPLSDSPPSRADLKGGNVLSRWSHTFSSHSQMSLQSYYDYTHRRELAITQDRHTFDIDFQHHFSRGRHDLVWGAGYRLSENDSHGSFTISLDPSEVLDNLVSAFAQDEITLVKDRLRFTLGLKVEHNNYTGVEVQPTARAVWTPDATHTLWAAVSRAVRTPSNFEAYTHLKTAAFVGQGGLPTFILLNGNPESRSEVLLAYEVGYRVRPARNLFLDIASFYNDYDHLQSAEPGTPFFESSPVPHLTIPLRVDKKLKGRSYGIETSADWEVTSRWKLSAGQTWLHFDLQPGETSLDRTSALLKGRNPRGQYRVMSDFNLPRGIEIDGSLNYVGGLKHLNVPAYTRLDARVGWQVSEKLGLSFAGQNLLKSRHLEFGNTESNTASWSQRSFYGKLTWRF